MTAPATRVPCTVVTGFLGAGKTTLIRNILEQSKDKRLAIIVNEFGDVGIDGEILKNCGIETCPGENIVELANGCICCTVAPNSRIRCTLGDWRCTSWAPMKISQRSPCRAQATAVATPCCPAPVSAITRRLPIRSASRTCPRVLLSLCAPVWTRSSRLRTGSTTS